METVIQIKRSTRWIFREETNETSENLFSVLISYESFCLTKDTWISFHWYTWLEEKAGNQFPQPRRDAVGRNFWKKRRIVLTIDRELLTVLLFCNSVSHLQKSCSDISVLNRKMKELDLFNENNCVTKFCVSEGINLILCQMLTFVTICTAK